MTGLRTSLSLDLRALAAFRVGLGILIIFDVLMRATDLTAHYTDAGILPVGPYVEQFANKLHISLHLANGSAGWIAFLFALQLLAGVALLSGYRTRLATVVAWVLLVSTHNRNPMILNGGDVLFRMLLFWGMFLPLGARFSIDHALAKDPGPRSNRYFGGPSVALTLQVIFIYAATAALKSGKEWWPEGTASYYALALDQFTTAFGVWMSQWYDLLRLSTYGVFALEVAAPLLLLSPILYPWARTLTLFALIGMHLNFDLTMRLGIFPWVDVVALVALLPAEFWDGLARRVKTSERLDLQIHYDGGCAFCRKAVLLLKEFLLIPETRVTPADDDPKVLKLLEAERSWVVVDHTGAKHLRYDALVTTFEHAPILGGVVRRLGLRRLSFVGDPAYRLIASRRSLLGKVTKVLLPYREQPAPETTWLINALSLFFIGYVALWNLKTIPRAGVTILAPWDKIGPVLRLDQTWNMFAPFPLKDDGWFVIDGTLVDGSKVDGMTGLAGQASFEKPRLVSAQHPNARWRKYMMNINSKKKKAHRLYFGKQLCRAWNQDVEYQKRLKDFELVFMKERTQPYGTPLKIERISLWRHDCFKKAGEELPAPAQGAATPSTPTSPAAPAVEVEAPTTSDDPVP